MNDGEFQDPLENYDPKNFDDPLAKALAEHSVSHIQHQPHVTIHPDTSLVDAINKLASGHVACLLVEEDGKLIGVFTHREVLNKIALETAQDQRTVGEVMTKNPVYVYADQPAAAALAVMAVSGHRHVPVVDSHERIVGIVSPQRVTAFLSKQLASE